MIVMKFGGTALADASRIRAAGEIVRGQLGLRPMVVVSALAGVTDLLIRAVSAAREGDRAGLEPILADLERRHRWALAGSVEHAGRRHDLSVAVDDLFEDLRQLLRSVRILGEGTPRSSDALLAFGEILAGNIVSAAFLDSGLPARWVDPREVLITDDRHGAAEPDLDAIARRCREGILPLLEAGEVPITGGFVGATRRGHTTTLGRGGSDTSASVLGSAMDAKEIQIWTDVDGILSADPDVAPNARLLERISFSEAAELAYYGAKVLHPASIEPAVRRQIPVRVRNALRPEGTGTVILALSAADAPPIASVSSRGGVSTVRVTSPRMRMDPDFVPRVLGAFHQEGIVPDLVVSSEVAVTVVFPGRRDLEGVLRLLGDGMRLESAEERAILCVVGSGLAGDGSARGRVLSALAGFDPEVVALGASGTSVAAVFPEAVLGDAVRSMHRRFFEGEGDP